MQKYCIQRFIFTSVFASSIQITCLSVEIHTNTRARSTLRNKSLYKVKPGSLTIRHQQLLVPSNYFTVMLFSVTKLRLVFLLFSLEKILTAEVNSVLPQVQHTYPPKKSLRLDFVSGWLISPALVESIIKSLGITTLTYRYPNTVLSYRVTGLYLSKS